MALDVSVPAPPSLHGPQTRGDYEAIDNEIIDFDDDSRREELEAILENGAWRDAFEEWAGVTDLSAPQFEVVQQLHMIEAIDLYWDPASDEVGYRSPSFTDDAASKFADADPGTIESELDLLGRIVSEVLENDYLLRDEEDFRFFADDESEDAYGDREE